MVDNRTDHDAAAADGGSDGDDDGDDEDKDDGDDVDANVDDVTDNDNDNDSAHEHSTIGSFLGFQNKHQPHPKCLHGASHLTDHPRGEHHQVLHAADREAIKKQSLACPGSHNLG